MTVRMLKSSQFGKISKKQEGINQQGGNIFQIYLKSKVEKKICSSVRDFRVQGQRSKIVGTLWTTPNPLCMMLAVQPIQNLEA